MARPSGSQDVAPRIRGAFKRACIILDKNGKEGTGITELMVQSLQEDFRGTLQALKGFIPKEMDIDVNAVVDHEAWLGQLDDSGQRPVIEHIPAEQPKEHE